jgi:acetyl-CoA carboxylase biotin carboxylase subunit
MVFMKLLVANRGEIAIRVIRACKELGIKTVAIYSEVDKWAQHVSLADEAFYVGPPQASQSYLKIDKIIQIAKKTRCRLIHPGYGFLAENPDFVRACEQNKITFVGPSSNTMALVGHKINAKIAAAQCGVPIIPGFLERAETSEDAKSSAQKIGYPVLLKAAAGGGGKGMRVVLKPEEMHRAFREAQSEAKSAFADPTIFVEKFIERPRHVEIQILADKYQNVVALGERECSIQRRHQKLLEESPSPAVDNKLREKMCQYAINLAKGIGYTTAGTFEFVLDQNKNPYFLEVNARVQVEHPVTEMVTKIDIVKHQIMLALGEKLQLQQEDIKLDGHAMECRILAEDPLANFVPSSGEILNMRLPSGPFVRVDTGYGPGDVITYFYDSLLAKLIVWADTRQMCIRRMLRALKEFKIVGIKTTIPFFINVLQNKNFVNGNYNTDFIKCEDVFMPPRERLFEAIALAVVLDAEFKAKSTLRYRTPAHLSPWKREVLER